jgi:hypothetical protein
MSATFSRNILNKSLAAHLPNVNRPAARVFRAGRPITPRLRREERRAYRCVELAQLLFKESASCSKPKCLPQPF